MLVSRQFREAIMAGTKQPKRPAKATAVYQELLASLSELGSPSGTPKYYVAPKKQHETRWPLLPLASDEEMARLTQWLDALWLHGKSRAYSALLQVWLKSHHLSWPDGVFAHDLTSRPVGRPRAQHDKVASALHMRRHGESYGQIALTLFPDIRKIVAKDARTAVAKIAADRVRGWVASAEKARRRSPIEARIEDLGRKMLGIPTEEEIS
jgi:hypothetical protein